MLRLTQHEVIRFFVKNVCEWPESAVERAITELALTWWSFNGPNAISISYFDDRDRTHGSISIIMGNHQSRYGVGRDHLFVVWKNPEGEVVGKELSSEKTRDWKFFRVVNVKFQRDKLSIIVDKGPVIVYDTDGKSVPPRVEQFNLRIPEDIKIK